MHDSDEAVIRPTARVLMLDDAHRVLMFRGFDPLNRANAFWYPPGGGIEEGETAEDETSVCAWQWPSMNNSVRNFQSQSLLGGTLMSKRGLRTLRELGIVAILTLFAMIGVRTFLFQQFWVPSASMYNTLQKDDRIIASRLNFLVHGVHRGDVVVFHDPGGWLTPTLQQAGWRSSVERALGAIGVLPPDTGSDLVKRVIGTAGDNVVCCSAGGRLIVNGHNLDETDYAIGSSAGVRFDITVPQGRMFVMGDNRQHSSDSRFHLDVASGTVPLDLVRAVVVLRWWPLARVGRIDAAQVLQQANVGKA